MTKIDYLLVEGDVCFYENGKAWVVTDARGPLKRDLRLWKERSAAPWAVGKKDASPMPVLRVLLVVGARDFDVLEKHRKMFSSFSDFGR